MPFNKIPDPDNCVFPHRHRRDAGRLELGDESCQLRVEHFEGQISRVRVFGGRFGPSSSQVQIDLPRRSRRVGAVEVGPRGELHTLPAGGGPSVASAARRGFGACGSTWLFQFEVAESARFFGMGEKCVGFERSGVRSWFWNTDVWADFPLPQVKTGMPDPLYANVPWVIVKQGNAYLGLLLNAPGAAFVRTPPKPTRRASGDRRLWLGATDGPPDLFVIVGPDLRQLTCKLQRLLGVTPRPPLWALGHHQSRWGYESRAQLEELADRFARHRIPNDGLWLDIGYMRGFRVFTVNRKHWPGLRGALAALRARGQRVVPILDPGVKLEKGYEVYDEGKRKRAFCRTPEGGDFVGYVWPGKTVFPDFSLPSVRAFWARRVAALARHGFAGFWLDMNDPSTGPSDYASMLFSHGKSDHASYHNQYASGMAQASRQGLLAERPDERPFLLSRSACAGTARHAAVWTGDNCSNWHHLKKSIEVSVNLALSGIPFNGPDVPGFGLDADAELAAAWYKLGFLFPFLRNHCQVGNRAQEPWTFGRASLVIRKYVRLRYKLLPYLYQLFVRQEQSGEAILRPMFHDFEDRAGLPLSEVCDQFLVGPDLLQAPIVEAGATSRRVILPDGRWYEGHAGRWKRGGRASRVRCSASETPLYVRDGSLVPMQRGVRTSNDNDLSRIELHVFCAPGAEGGLRYAFDDGRTFAYRRGEQSELELSARARGRVIEVAAELASGGAGGASVVFVLHGGASELWLTRGGERRRLALRAARCELTGGPLEVMISRPVTFDA